MTFHDFQCNKTQKSTKFINLNIRYIRIKYIAKGIISIPLHHKINSQQKRLSYFLYFCISLTQFNDKIFAGSIPPYY